MAESFYPIAQPMENPLSVEERVAATAVATLAANQNGKRDREEEDVQPRTKVPRAENDAAAVAVAGPSRPPMDESHGKEVVLKPFPYFYYRDYSTLQDPDPLTPLTAPGRVPNFPA